MKCCLDSFERCGFHVFGSGVIMHGSFFYVELKKKKKKPKKKHVKLVFTAVFCALNRLYIKKLSYPATSLSKYTFRPCLFVYVAFHVYWKAIFF
jgi:hypothetical protein